MAKQIRYGAYEDFKPEKMVTAELACVVSGDPAVSDGRSVYVCFTPGIVKRLTTYADFERELAAESEEIRSQFTQDIKDAIQDALDAKNAAETFVTQKGQEIDGLITETQKTTSDFVQQAQNDVNTAVTSTNASKQAADEATQKALDAADKANEAAGGANPTIFGSYDDFPRPGEENRLYVDDTADPRLIYTWDAETDDYILTGGAGGDLPNNTVIVPVEAGGWALDNTTQRYQKTVEVKGMKAGMGGHWDIVRSGGVITREESEISLNITDVERLDGAIKISCVKALEKMFTLILFGTYKEASDGDTLVSGLSGLFKRVQINEEKLSIFDSLLTPQMHRTIFRGKNLGSELTKAQKEAIRTGTFKDLYLGDYWSINNRTWRIADMDYWYGQGDTPCTTHHVVVIPDSQLYTHNMNTQDVTTGGYTGSEMYTSGLNQAKQIVTQDFGTNVLSHRELFTNTVASGYASNGTWFDSTVDLPNEIMMYGSYIFTSGSTGTVIPYLHTIDKTQLALMQVAPFYINPVGQTIWLRDVVSVSIFAVFYGGGNTAYATASNVLGVRPVVGITG